MDKNLIDRINKFKKFLKEETIRVPGFRNVEDMKYFLAKTPSGVKFDIDIINPKTKEVEWDSTDIWVNPQDAIDAQEAEEAEDYSYDPSDWDDDEDEEYTYSSYLDQYDFEDFYNVEWVDLTDEIDPESEEAIRKEYDVELSYVKSIERADGLELTDNDVKNIQNYFKDYKKGKFGYIPDNIQFDLIVQAGKDKATTLYSFM